MATKQNVSFGQPTALMQYTAPDLIVEQQQIARRQALIDVLREQGLQPIDGGRGAISWTQGLAKLLGTWAAGSMQKKNDARSVMVNKGLSNAIAPQFGLPRVWGPDGSRVATNPAPMPMQPQTAAAPQPSFDQAFSPDTAQALQQGQPLPPMPEQPMPASVPAQASPPPLASPQAAAGPQSYPMRSSGDPMTDIFNYSSNPEAYSEQKIKTDAPNDFARQLMQSGIDPRSPLGQQLMQQQTAKLNYVAPINGRPGSAIRDPYNPSKVLGYDAPTIEGAFPIYGPDGMPTGYQQAPGATQAMAAAAGAKTAAQNANEPIAGYDANGNPVFGNKLAAAQGGNSNFRPGAPLGAVAAYDVQGKAAAEKANAWAESAAGAPDRIFALRQIQTLARDPSTITGPGSNWVNTTKGVMSTLSSQFGLAPPQSVTNAGEMNKWLAQYGARQAESLGLSGSDARLNLAVHASPNGEMTPQAFNAMLPTFIGFDMSNIDRNQMWQRYQKSYGLQSAQDFQTEWSQAYDPRVYTWMAGGGVKNVAAQVKAIKNPAERRALLQKYDRMKALGASFSE